MFNELAKSLEPNPIHQILNDDEELLKFANNYDVQIILSQITRDKKNRACLKTYKYQVDDEYFYYPAQSVKLLLAIFALEKLNDIDFNGMDKFTRMKSIAEIEINEKGNKLTNIYDCIKFSLSNQNEDASNKLYDFVDRININKKLKYYGFKRTKIVNRLGIIESIEDARKTPKIEFYINDKTIFKKGISYDKFNYPIKFKNSAGFLDLSTKNAFQIKDQHEMLKRLFFSKNYPSKKQFNLKVDDVDFLLKCMLDSKIEHKFLFYGGDFNAYQSANLKIFNTSGKSLNHILDNSYLIDNHNNIEFILSVVINTKHAAKNSNLELDFLKILGQKVYGYELKRDKKSISNL